MLFELIETTCLKQINYVHTYNFARRFCKVSQSWKVLFFGTDEFSVESLKKLHNSKPHVVKTLEIVTSDKSFTAIKKFASSHHIPVHNWPCEGLRGKFDVGIVASFGHLIPEKIISMFPWGMINVHASLLPKWRGAAPIVHTILNGDKMAGVTIMKIEPRHFDIGNILLQKSCTIPDDVTTKQLTRQLATIGADLLLECLQDLDKNLKNSVSQDSSRATKAPKVTPKLASVDWQSHSSYIDRQYRAISEYHALHSKWNGTQIKLDKMISQNLMNTLEIPRLISMNKLKYDPFVPGHIYIHRKRNILCVRCQDSWVGFQSVSVQGYKRMTPLEFYNGFLSKIEHAQWKFDITDNLRHTQNLVDFVNRT